MDEDDVAFRIMFVIGALVLIGYMYLLVIGLVASYEWVIHKIDPNFWGYVGIIAWIFALAGAVSHGGKD